MTQQETVDTNTDIEGKVPPGLVDQVHEERVSASVPPLGPPDSSQEQGTDLQDHHRNQQQALWPSSKKTVLEL